MDSESLYKLEDPALEARIKTFRRAAFDLQEIMSDPFLETTRTEVSAMMAAQDKVRNKDSYSEKESFVKNSLSKKDSKTKSEFQNIKISKSDINELSAEWVREWHKKKQMEVSSPADQERKNFISASIKSEEATPSAAGKESTESAIIPPQRKTRRLQFTSIAAAAVFGAIVTIRILVPSADADKIYDRFYSPYDDAVTLVTRGENNESARIYNQSVNNYKSGRYNEALRGFTESASINPSLGTPSYYLGLAAMETGDYDLAVTQFLNVISRSGNYVKESRWYLGLSYLKKGDREKAAEYFRELAKSEGYFSKPAEKILRRLE